MTGLGERTSGVASLNKDHGACGLRFQALIHNPVPQLSFNHNICFLPVACRARQTMPCPPFHPPLAPRCKKKQREAFRC